MKRFKNKKGFTLVELVVGTAILSVVGLTVAMLMTSGTNMYRRVHIRSNLLFKSQVAATQLQESIINCKAPFATFEDTLFLGDEEDDGDLVIHVYSLDGDTIKLRDDSVSDTGQVSPGEKSIPFCRNVSQIQYYPQDSSGTVYAMRFTLNIRKFGVEYPRNEVLSMRNRPALIKAATAGDTEAALASALVEWKNADNANTGG